MDEADALAAVVYPKLKQEGSLRRTPTEQGELEVLRDQLWTLLMEHHEHLAKVGAWQWGASVTSHVRPLLARQVKRKATNAKVVVESAAVEG